MKTLRIHKDHERLTFEGSINGTMIFKGDCIPIGDEYDEIQISKQAIEAGDNPRAWLSTLHDCCAKMGSLVIECEPVSTLELMRNLVAGDWAAQLIGQQNFRWELATLPLLYKVILDAGWAPDLESATFVNIEDSIELRLLIRFAELQGVPIQTMLRRLQIGTAKVRAKQIFDRNSCGFSRGPEKSVFSVITPITRTAQSNANINVSPGLLEVGASITCVDGAKSAAEALEIGLRQVKTDWILFCHQDVYFPTTFGERLNNILKQVQESEKHLKLFGFAGMGGGLFGEKATPAGFVVDRLKCFDHPSSSCAISIDEFAIVLSRDTIHKIDPRFGWHLWATDLCVAALRNGISGAIIRLPTFHNSYNDYSIPNAWHCSRVEFEKKYPNAGRIETLCGPIG